MKLRPVRNPLSHVALLTLLTFGVITPGTASAVTSRKIGLKIGQPNLSTGPTARQTAASKKALKAEPPALLSIPPEAVIEPTFDMTGSSALFASADAIARKLHDNDMFFPASALQGITNLTDFTSLYPDYYFRLMKENESAIGSISKLDKFMAWSPGRAYPESFGSLIRGDAASIFTVHDVESAGYGPIAVSFLQLLIGARNVDPHFRVDQMVDAYLSGIRGDELEAPHLAEDLLARSRVAGMIPDDSRAMRGHLLREPGVQELSEKERQLIQTNLDQFFPRKVNMLDGLKMRIESAHRKIQNKFSLLIESRGQTLVLDLLEEMPSALAIYTPSDATSLSDRLTTAFTIERGGMSVYEGAIQIGGIRYIMTPNFRGDLSLQIKLEEAGDTVEVGDLLQFEAYTLGQIQSRTLNEPLGYAKAVAAVPGESLARDVLAVSLFLERKLNSLIPVSSDEFLGRKPVSP